MATETSAQAEITLRKNHPYKKPWIAKIVGVSWTYRYFRVFLTPSIIKKPDWIFQLDDGYYEVCEHDEESGPLRRFLLVANGEISDAKVSEVNKAFPMPDHFDPPINWIPDKDVADALGIDRTTELKDGELQPGKDGMNMQVLFMLDQKLVTVEVGTRKTLITAIEEARKVPCPHCQGTGRIAPEAIKT